jgi:hypothetical protein
MANYPRNRPLGPDQLPNPILERVQVGFPHGFPFPAADDLHKVFPGNAHSLKTWGRTDGHWGVAPHWIGLSHGTDLHTDKAYPRYTHHLLVIVDPFVLRGLDNEECPLQRGTYVVVDTHSPHQLWAKERGARWYLAVSMDADHPLPRSETLPRLLEYGATMPLLTPEILAPNIGGRPK